MRGSGSYGLKSAAGTDVEHFPVGLLFGSPVFLNFLSFFLSFVASFRFLRPRPVCTFVETLYIYVALNAEHLLFSLGPLLLDPSPLPLSGHSSTTFSFQQLCPRPFGLSLICLYR